MRTGIGRSSAGIAGDPVAVAARDLRVKAFCSLTRTTVGGIMWLTSRQREKGRDGGRQQGELTCEAR